jgi:hypothetical protein
MGVDLVAELGIDFTDLADKEVTLCYGNNNPSLKTIYCQNAAPTAGHGNQGFRNMLNPGPHCHTDTHYMLLDAFWRKTGKDIYQKSQNANRDGKFCRLFDMESKGHLCYGNRYADIQKYLCGGTCWSDWHVAVIHNHWRTYGHKEGGARIWGCAPDKEALCYGSRYSDLRSKFCGHYICTTFVEGEKLRKHYNDYGVHNDQQGLTPFSILAELQPLSFPSNHSRYPT